MNQISPNYFHPGRAIVAGRDFNRNDNRDVKHGPEAFTGSTNVMINEKFAKKYSLAEIHRPPLGIRHDPGTPTDMEVIGVVKDFKYTNFATKSPSRPSFLILPIASSAVDRLRPHHHGSHH